MVTRIADAPVPLHPEGSTDMLDFKDLAPTITRQRMVVEGYPTFVITDEHIKDYLQRLSEVTDMITIIEPVTRSGGAVTRTGDGSGHRG